MSFAPLTLHTHYSLLGAIAKPHAIARRCVQYGYQAAAMTDTGNVGCAVDFVTTMKSTCACGHREDDHADKKGRCYTCECSCYCNYPIKPILGCEFSLCKEDASVKTADNGRPYSRLTVLAKNLAGWQNLISAVSRSGSKEHAYQGPRLQLEEMADFTQGRHLIALSGHLGSDLANAMFDDPKKAYHTPTYDDVTALISGDWRKRLLSLGDQYISTFGKENFFLEVQVNDPDAIPATIVVSRTMRWLGKKLGIQCVATADTRYVDVGDDNDHRVVLCSGMETTLNVARKSKAYEAKDLTMGNFFRSRRFHLPSPDDLATHHTEQEIEQSSRIADMCEDYKILHSPMLPHFPCPDGMSAEGYLRELCEKGWADKIEGRSLSQPIEVYRDRLEMELGVINGAGLPSYFLIVQDFVNYAKERRWILSPGRGSGAGCIISYLTGITGIDPIQYGLIFERFYNAGRNAPGKVSLPDIDSDFPKHKRDEIYAYLQVKYGEAYVAKIATFSTMQGRSALTEVMRAHEEDFDLTKRITKLIPDKHTITEELEEMRQQGEEPSIIAYALDVLGEDLAEWARMEEDGSISGEYGARFAQAIRLEGVKKHIGTHAAGVLIGAVPLAGFCPTKYDDKSHSTIAAMEYPALEAMGGCKVDVLSVAVLDKAQAVRSQVRTGRIYDDTVVG